MSPTASLGTMEGAALAYLRAKLNAAQGSRVPLGAVWEALRKVAPVARVSVAVLERARPLAAGGAARSAGGAFCFYGVGASDGVVDLAEPGFRAEPDDDRNVARVLAGAPALVHALAAEAGTRGAVDRTLWMKGIRSTAVFPLACADGTLFATMNVGSTAPDGLTDGIRPLLAAAAGELQGPLWRALGAARGAA
ncbi:MAG TPA: hypothetical protein VG389_00840 [Myxococcota bacterium]|jgi:hypothetical protein|nr:hypothetical protein [Myxococcota bacterium]